MNKSYPRNQSIFILLSFFFVTSKYVPTKDLLRDSNHKPKYKTIVKQNYSMISQQQMSKYDNQTISHTQTKYSN